MHAFKVYNFIHYMNEKMLGFSKNIMFYLTQQDLPTLMNELYGNPDIEQIKKIILLFSKLNLCNNEIRLPFLYETDYVLLGHYIRGMFC